jgi:hypothetical protein
MFRDGDTENNFVSSHDQEIHKQEL